MHLGVLKVVILRLATQPQLPEHTNLVGYEIPEKEILCFHTAPFHQPASELSTVASAQLSLDSTSRRVRSPNVTRRIAVYITQIDRDLSPKVTKAQQDISQKSVEIYHRRSPKPNGYITEIDRDLSPMSPKAIKIYHRRQSGSDTEGHQSPAGYITEVDQDLSPMVTKGYQDISPKTIGIYHQRSPNAGYITESEPDLSPKVTEG